MKTHLAPNGEYITVPDGLNDRQEWCIVQQ